MKEKVPASRRGSAVGLLAGTLSGQALNFVAGLLMARVLGPTGRGEVALVGVYDEVSTNTLNLGMPAAAGFFAKEQHQGVESLLRASRRFALLMLPISVTLGAVVALVLLRNISPGARWVGFAVVALTPLANTYYLTRRNILLAQGRLRSLAAAPFIQGLAKLGGLALFWVVGILVSWTAASVVALTALVGNVVAGAALRTERRTQVQSAPLRPLLAYGVRTVPGALSNLANARLDQLLIAPYLGTRALGIYAVAVGLNSIPVSVGMSLAQSSYSKVRLADTDSRARAGDALRRASLIIGLSCLATAVAAGLSIQFLYGERFAGALTPTMILLPGSFAFGLHVVANFVANALGRPSYGSIGQVVGLIVTVVGLLVALPLWGINGAAAVSTASYAIRAGVTIWLLRKTGVSGLRPRAADVRSLVGHGRRYGTRLLTARGQRTHDS